MNYREKLINYLEEYENFNNIYFNKDMIYFKCIVFEIKGTHNFSYSLDKSQFYLDENLELVIMDNYLKKNLEKDWEIIKKEINKFKEMIDLEKRLQRDLKNNKQTKNKKVKI